MCINLSLCLLISPCFHAGNVNRFGAVGSKKMLEMLVMLITFGVTAPKSLTCPLWETKIARNVGLFVFFGVGSHKLLACPMWESKSAQNVGVLRLFGAVGIKKCLKRWPPKTIDIEDIINVTSGLSNLYPSPKLEFSGPDLGENKNLILQVTGGKRA